MKKGFRNVEKAVSSKDNSKDDDIASNSTHFTSFSHATAHEKRASQNVRDTLKSFVYPVDGDPQFHTLQYSFSASSFAAASETPHCVDGVRSDGFSASPETHHPTVFVPPARTTHNVLRTVKEEGSPSRQKSPSPKTVESLSTQHTFALNDLTTTSTNPIVPLSPNLKPAQCDLTKGKNINEKVENCLSKHMTEDLGLGSFIDEPPMLDTRKTSSKNVGTMVLYSPPHELDPEDLWSEVSVSFEKEDVSSERLRGKWHKTKISSQQN
jgi:hypothetical protein